MKKEFKLNTHDIQMLIISLIYDSTNHEGYLHDKPEVYEKLSGIFSEMNNLCWEGNDYTISLTAEG